jgi:hypothetical protein
MKQRSLFAGCLLVLATVSDAVELSGNIAVEARVYPQSGQFAQQQDESLSLSFQPKLSHAWNQGSDQLVVELFLRLDPENDNREHADIGEFKWLHVDGDNEWRVGIDSVFWGVTESQHLVDVINSIDRVEGFDGEDKLGQPMVHYTRLLDSGVFHAFLLPGFRQSEFHSVEGRLRLPLPVDADEARFESSNEQSHVDYALRYTHFLGDTEWGFSWFDGTSRDPQYQQTLVGGSSVLVPYYAQITQVGFDLQSLIGDWIWKWEVIHRDQKSGAYSATTAGFEYTFYGVFDSAVDMGTLLEYSHDSRNDDEAGPLNNDLFGGLRFAFNDVQSTEILGGAFVDVENGSKMLRVEASRRIGDSWKLTGEMQVFTSIDDEDVIKAFERDDFLLIELARYF